MCILKEDQNVDSMWMSSFLFHTITMHCKPIHDNTKTFYTDFILRSQIETTTAEQAESTRVEPDSQKHLLN